MSQDWDKLSHTKARQSMSQYKGRLCTYLKTKRYVMSQHEMLKLR